MPISSHSSKAGRSERRPGEVNTQCVLELQARNRHTSSIKGPRRRQSLPKQYPPTSSTFFTWHRPGPEQISLPRGETTPGTGATSPRPRLRRLYGHRRRRPEIFPRGETGIPAGNDPSRCPGGQCVYHKFNDMRSVWERPRDGETVTSGRSIPNLARRTGPWSILEMAREVDLLRDGAEIWGLVCATKEYLLGRGVFMS